MAAAFRTTQRTLFTPPPLTIAGVSAGPRPGLQGVELMGAIFSLEPCTQLHSCCGQGRPPPRPAPPRARRQVFKAFTEIARCEGAKSQDRKRGMIVKLLAAAKGGEAGYVMRALQGKLRIGLAEQTVLVALAHAVVLQREGAALVASHEAIADRLETAAQAVKAGYSECPSYDELVPALLELPIEELASRVHFKPGVPVKPMLAKPTTGKWVGGWVGAQRCRVQPTQGAAPPKEPTPGCALRGPYSLPLLPATTRTPATTPAPPPPPTPAPLGVTEVLDKFTDAEFTVEYKYDGERAQIHVTEDGAVRIYSRNSEDNTPKYPDIAALIPRVLAPGVTSLVLDAEAVAIDRATGKVLPFQVLSTRARKGVDVADITVNVCVFAFDCLYLNGKTLLREPLTARREALYSALAPITGEVEFASAKVGELRRGVRTLPRAELPYSSRLGTRSCCSITNPITSSLTQ